tara:strand:- start:680 stop:1039 length:360 start_codon:yes stop_codon:yes gene_type:complete
MKKFILATVAALFFALPAQAIDLGFMSLDNQVKAGYNVDTEVSSLTAQTGVTVPIWIMSASIDADMDLLAFGDSSKEMYQGIDIGLDLPLHDMLVLELDTGIDTDWNRENISLTATLSF